MQCKCKPDCEAAVAADSKYARGHNPASHVGFKSSANSERMKRLWKRASFRRKVMKTRRTTMYSNPLWKEKAGEKNRGRQPWNFGENKETSSSLMSTSETVKGQWKDPSITEKRLATLRKIYRNEEWIKKVNPQGAYYEGRNGKIWMRSSWEIAFAKWCDSRNMPWKYEPRMFKVSHNRTYRPDFYLKLQRYWVEIKGYLTEEARRKIVDFCVKFRPRFILLRQRELAALGVLT